MRSVFDLSFCNLFCAPSPWRGAARTRARPSPWRQWAAAGSAGEARRRSPRGGGGCASENEITPMNALAAPEEEILHRAASEASTPPALVAKTCALGDAAGPTISTFEQIGTCGVRAHAGGAHRLGRPTPSPLSKNVCGAKHVWPAENAYVFFERRGAAPARGCWRAMGGGLGPGSLWLEPRN